MDASAQNLRKCWLIKDEFGSSIYSGLKRRIVLGKIFVLVVVAEAERTASIRRL